MTSRLLEPLAAVASDRTLQHERDDLLDLEDVLGRRVISTRLLVNILIGEEQCSAAVEAMSRFAVDPRWLVYLPPPAEVDAAVAWWRAREVGRKRALAAREFALGVESLERIVAREPLRRVHECVFAVLALETEPVDPRL